MKDVRDQRRRGGGEFIEEMVDSREVTRGEKMALRGTDSASYIIEHTLVYEDEHDERHVGLGIQPRVG